MCPAAYSFHLNLVHFLESNQLIKHCNLNCTKMYEENLYTGCLLSERAIHEMSLAELISVWFLETRVCDDDWVNICDSVSKAWLWQPLREVLLTALPQIFSWPKDHMPSQTSWEKLMILHASAAFPSQSQPTGVCIQLLQFSLLAVLKAYMR